MLADVAIACAWEAGEFADFACPIFGDVADAVAIAGEYLNSLRVVGIGRVGFQGGNKLAEVVVYVFAVGDACNIKLDIVYTLKALILWPHGDVVAFILDAEVAKALNTGFVNGMRSRCPRTVI